MYSKDFPELKNYEYAVDDGWGNTGPPIKINEVDCAMKAAKGERKPAGDAGIRLGNQKFMFIKYDDITQTTQCSCSFGGAAMGNTKDAIVIGFFDKNKAMSDGQPQTSGLCAEQVQVMRAFLE